MEEKIQLSGVLIDIGFQCVANVWEFNFGNFKIKGFRYFDPFDVIHFNGYYRNSRTAREFDFKLPTEVDNYEQGVALLAYNFKGATLDITPDWMIKGREWNEHLPWMKKSAERSRKERERREFEVQFDYEMFKVLLKKLRNWYEQREHYATIQFSFDGEVMRVRSGDDHMLLGGKGKAWTNIAVIEIAQLEKLPKRVLRNYTEIIWHKEDLYLCFGKYCNVQYIKPSSP